MAQRQRRPAQQEGQTEQGQQVLERMQRIVDMVRNTHLTPEQIQKLENFVNQMENLLRQQQAHATPTQSVPRHTQTPAPRRVQQFVYDITVEGRTYQLTLDERLPTDSHGRVNPAAARERLHDALLHNQPAPLGGQMHADVRMVHSAGGPQEVTHYNTGPANQRMDIFRDRYLAHSYQQGKYVDDPGIAIAEVRNVSRGG
jgi:hypothetical protein